MWFGAWQTRLQLSCCGGHPTARQPSGLVVEACHLQLGVQTLDWDQTVPASLPTPGCCCRLLCSVTNIWRQQRCGTHHSQVAASTHRPSHAPPLPSYGTFYPASSVSPLPPPSPPATCRGSATSNQTTCSRQMARIHVSPRGQLPLARAPDSASPPLWLRCCSG